MSDNIAEIFARIRRLKVGAAWQDMADLIEHQQRALTAERERADRNQEDAERYRWLKKQRPQPMWAAIPMRLQLLVRDDEDAIDGAIDAAMRKP